MKKMQRNFAVALLGAAALWGSGPVAYADVPGGEPILTFKSNIYGYQGPGNLFTIYLGSTKENAKFYIESPVASDYVTVNPYTIGSGSDGSQTTIATAIGLGVTEGDNEVRIYGDASELDFVDFHGCYLESVDFTGNFVNLTVVDLSHNELTEIDLSEIPSLYSIDISDNAFTVPSKMKIGTDHPELMILYVGINEVIDPEFDLRNFPKLLYFSAYSNSGVTAVDPSGCPDLVSLQLDGTNISSIDVSRNLKLDILNLSQTKVSSVDLSANVALGELYISHDGSVNSDDRYKLTSIDLSKNVNLEYLDLGGNNLTSIDLSNNTRLKMLYLMRNYLTGIDLSACTQLAKVDLSNNCMDFSNLPLPQYGWDYYYYQRPLPVEMKYKVGEPIDFSRQVIRAPYRDEDGKMVTPQTYAAVFINPRAGEIDELPSSYYTFRDGVLTFKEAVSHPVYVTFHCTAFEEWDLRSGEFIVKTPAEFDLPALAFSFTPDASMAGKEIGFRVGAIPTVSGVTLPADVVVAMGDSEMVLEGAVSGPGLPEENNIVLTLPETVMPVKVLLPDGLALGSLEMNGILLSAIDLIPSDYITELTICDAGLEKIDLSYNRDLRSLKLTGNAFTALDLSGVRGDYEKWELADVDLSGNLLSSLKAVHYKSILNLNLSDNRFEEFDAKYYTALESLNLSGNNIQGTIDLSASPSLQSLNLSGNAVSKVLAADWNSMTQIDLSDNSLTFATLPLITSADAEYAYVPQMPVEILKSAAAIDLSSQNVVSGGQGTSYVWKYADGSGVVPSDKYTAEGGAFRFDASLAGMSIYCEMTNPAFPDFDSNPLLSTPTTVAAVPSVLVASFTTAQDGEAQIGFIFNKSGENAVYIDWTGEGLEYEPYIYTAGTTGSGIYRSGKTFAGKTAKVYSYTSAADVATFALQGTPLLDFDGSPMTGMTELLLWNTGLTDGHIILPESNALTSLVVCGSNLETEDFAQCTSLTQLNLGSNKYKTFDLTPFKNLEFANLAQNRLESVELGENSSIFQLILENNQLKSIDLTGTNISQLLLTSNDLEEIDLSPVKETLTALTVAGNRFTFATLPIIEEEAPNLTFFDCFGQKPYAVEAQGASIDLSDQAEINGQLTTYRWFLGNNSSDVYFDYNDEVFVGIELEGPDVSDDPEYVIADGVTTFLYPLEKKVICAMTNPQFPSLILYTLPASVEVSGVDAIDADETVDVFTVTGVCVRKGVQASEAVRGLSSGLYIIGGRKVLVR